MTPIKHADQLMRRLSDEGISESELYSLKVESMIAEAINRAIEEEREACANIVERARLRTMSLPQIDVYPAIAGLIRARANR